MVPMTVIDLVALGSTPHSKIAADLTKSKFNPGALDHLVGNDSESFSTRYSTPKDMKGANDIEDSGKVVSLESESYQLDTALPEDIQATNDIEDGEKVVDLESESYQLDTAYVDKALISAWRLNKVHRCITLEEDPPF